MQVSFHGNYPNPPPSQMTRERAHLHYPFPMQDLLFLRELFLPFGVPNEVCLRSSSNSNAPPPQKKREKSKDVKRLLDVFVEEL